VAVFIISIGGVKNYIQILVIYTRAPDHTNVSLDITIMSPALTKMNLYPFWASFIHNGVPSLSPPKTHN
jgi:hypothetical protein